MKHSRNHIIFRFIPFFFRFVQIDLRSGFLHAFFSRRQEKKVPLYNQSFFVISPVRSNPFPQFFTGSFAVDFGDHLRSRIICGPFWGSFAVSGSFAVLYSASTGFCPEIPAGAIKGIRTSSGDKTVWVSNLVLPNLHIWVCGKIVRRRFHW